MSGEDSTQEQSQPGTVGFRDRGQRLRKVETELGILSYKIGVMVDGIDNLKDLVAKQTEIMTTFAILEERFQNLQTKVETLDRNKYQDEKEQGELKAFIGSVRMSRNILLAGAGIIISALGWWYTSDLTARQEEAASISSIQTQMLNNKDYLKSLQQQINGIRNGSLGVDAGLDDNASPDVVGTHPQSRKTHTR